MKNGQYVKISIIKTPEKFQNSKDFATGREESYSKRTGFQLRQKMTLSAVLGDSPTRRSI